MCSIFPSVYIDGRKYGKDLWVREKHSYFLEKAPPMFEKTHPLNLSSPQFIAN